MKRVSNISNNITVGDIAKAANRASEGHKAKPEVKEFFDAFDANCALLFSALQDGSWKERVRYRRMEKTNPNGKQRKIDSPSFETRIYQHLFLNLVEPVYQKKDNGNGRNCKKGYGITSKEKGKSVLHELKHVFYDRTDLKYCLVIDQRKCYEHATVKAFRKAMKCLVSDKWLVDFGTAVCFLRGSLPIGTPTSPFVHHVMMLRFDIFAKDIAPFSVRYADDNFLAFPTKEEANEAKWRVANFWWYELGMRAKRHSVSIRPMDRGIDFCGYVFHRNAGRGSCDHDKGYTRIRKSTADRAKKCRSSQSWASYFGLMKHADAYSLMAKIEDRMKLSELTSKIRINRKMDARHIDVYDLVGETINIYDYELRKNAKGEANWIKCLIGMRERDADGNLTGKMLAYEFHGNFQYIIEYITECEKAFGKDAMIPLEDMEIENQCGYIFKGSTNQLKYIL